jgi:hypothetical protein
MARQAGGNDSDVNQTSFHAEQEYAKAATEIKAHYLTI